MEINLTSLGKRYGLEWIFRKVDFQFQSGNSYALTGHNGSGKSTLLKVLSGGLTPSEGKIEFKEGNKIYSQIEIAKDVAYVAPYINLIDDFTLLEMIEFHFQFKKMYVTQSELLEILDLNQHKNKAIHNFSSGMMQRLKLSLAILSETKILLLDEPTSYLDEKAILWYKNLLQDYIFDRLVILGSNQKHEYTFVEGGEIHLPDYKYAKKQRHGTQL